MTIERVTDHDGPGLTPVSPLTYTRRATGDQSFVTIAAPTAPPRTQSARQSPVHFSAVDRRPFARFDGTRYRAWASRYVRRILFGDVLSVIWAAVGAHLVHKGAVFSRVSAQPASLPIIAITITLSAGWLLALHWGGTRDVEIVGYGPEEYKRLIQVSFGYFGLVAVCSYIFALHLPRAYVLVMLPAGLVALLLTRFTWRRWLHVHRMSGRLMSKVLVVGNHRTVRELLVDLRRAPLAGYRVLGVCVQQNTAIGDFEADDLGRPTLDGVLVLGGLDDVAGTALAYGADAVAVTSTAAFGPAAVRRLSWDLETSDIHLILAPALTNVAGTRIHTKPVAGLPLILVDRPTYRGANRLVKRCFDAVGAFLLLTVFSPILLSVAIAVKSSSAGPVFFRQQRVGLNGGLFRMVKFRSMEIDAEARLAELKNADRDAGNETLFKMRDDPRITRVGRFIRRFSLDELPQLFNVLKGDMSLVGPRPPLSDEVATYSGEAHLRLLVRPGMTGLWQVSGRSTLSWEDSVRLDTYYVENWSLTADLVILWKTARAVTSSNGAF